MVKQAKYRKIYDYYKEEIRSGRMPVNTPLPPEQEILKQFGCSHMTLNKAATRLSANGYIKRIPGIGTFVCDDFNKTLTSHFSEQLSLNQMIEQAGMVPKTELVSYNICKQKDTPRDTEFLKIDENDFVHDIVRLKYGNDRLFCYSETFLSQRVLPVIDVTKLEGSLDNYVIHELHIQKSHGSSNARACLPDKEISKYFGTDKIALMKQTIYWYSGDTPFEITYNYFPGDLMIISNPERFNIVNNPD